MNEKNYQSIIKLSIQKLISENGYTQVEIFKKFQQLEIRVSRASISNFCNEKYGSISLLRETARGFKLIMERELCLTFNENANQFEKRKNCSPRPILIDKKIITSEIEIRHQPYSIFDGRMDVTDKVELYQKAKYEILEIGLRLKNFRSYFEEKRESAFLDPLKKILENGVNFKCYVIDPKGNYARKYIEDRATSQPSEIELLEDIPRITTELRNIFIRINREGYNGKMELYQYDHFPYYHSTVIDGGTENGNLNIAPYLYGISRANTPVIQLQQKSNKVLFKKYWKSVKTLVNSKQVTKIICS